MRKRKRFDKIPQGLVAISLILISAFAIAYKFEPVLAGTYLTLKWQADIGAQTVIGALAADLDGDGSLEIVVTGGTNVTALRGTDGSVFWTVAPGGIGEHSPFEIIDLNNDGLPEIVVAAGTALALHGINGSVYWRNTAAPADGHFLTVADIDGFGYPTVFVNSGNGPSQGYDYITSLTYDGKILYRTICWHPCYGGLTIGDTNFDGRFELYQGDRSIYYNPPEDPYKYGGWGVRCIDAHTLTPIWNDSTVLCSSHCPILADVDKDGILDVIVADQGNDGVAVYWSANGSVVTTGGKYRKGSIGSPAHSQPTVYDIDGDGNLEIITCSGSNPVIWDLYEWKLDYTLPRSAGEPPKVGDVTGDGKMDIILSSGSSIYIYSYNSITKSYDQVDYVTGLSGANAFTLLADVDDDGYLELIVTSSSASGPVYCFDTPTPTPNPPPRTNYHFYSEYRCGAAEYVPPAGPSTPALLYEQPRNGSTRQPLNPKLSVRAVDFQGDLMNITFWTNATGTWEKIAEYVNVANGIYNATSTNMNNYGTTYYWGVNATDSGSGSYRWVVFKFTTYQPASWWDNKWLYRKPISIDHSKVAANLTSFPVLVDVTDVDLALKARADGDDVAFTDYYGNKLDHEIEYFDGSTGRLVAWVRIPLLSSTEDTMIYMYYGSPLSGQQNPSGVWDSNFLAVHHLEETSGAVYDSTINNNHGTPYGNLNLSVLGKINGAAYFDGVDDDIELPQIFTSETQFTMEAWFYAEAGSEFNAGYILSQRIPSVGVLFNVYNNSALQFFVNVNSTSKSIALNTWYYVVGTFDGSTATLFLNGGAPTSFAADLTWPSVNMYIGDIADRNRHWKGMIDEVRISNIARSAAWIEACYNNQYDPSSFYTVGAEELGIPAEAPIVHDPSPANGETNVSVHITEISFSLTDYQGDMMSFTVTTSPYIGYGSATNVGNGRYSIPVKYLSYSTTYTIYVNVTDGVYWTYETFQFTTGPRPQYWWNNSWPYRKPIIIDHTKVAADLTDFPVLIDITDVDLAAKAQDDGDDIVFTDYYGNKLDHEIEYFDCSTGRLVAWVRIPLLSSTEDTTIYMYYGNPPASNQENAFGVWDSNFLAVHHLEETSGAVYDSTINNNHGTPYNGVQQGVPGKINSAAYFDGINDRIILSQVFSTENQFTMEAWIYAETGARYFISQWDNNNGVFIQVGATGNSIEWYINGGSAGSTSISLNTWYYVVATYEGSDARLYLNAGAPITKASSPPNWPSQGTYISDRYAGQRQFHGYIDEVRLSNIARSAEWIKTCFNNQYNPASYYTVGIEQQAPPSETIMFISPAETSVVPNSECTVYIEIAYVSDLYAWEFQLEYDPEILDLISASVVPGGLKEPTTIYYNLTDEANGHLWWSISTTPPETTGITYDRHAIFMIRFRAIGAGTSELRLYSTNLSDSNATPIMHSVVGGSITVTGTVDLTVTSITILNHGCSIYANDTCADGSTYYYPVEVIIRNSGTISAGSFYVKLEIYWGSLLESSDEILVPGVAAGESVTVNFTSLFHPIHLGYYSIVAIADSRDNVTESDETNNVLELDDIPITLIGDINGDGVVNILDAVKISLAWNSKPGDSHWKVCADINHDGQVDILDAVRISLHWGETW